MSDVADRDDDERQPGEPDERDEEQPDDPGGPVVLQVHSTRHTHTGTCRMVGGGR